MKTQLEADRLRKELKANGPMPLGKLDRYGDGIDYGDYA
jgi:hypothetical protein